MDHSEEYSTSDEEDMVNEPIVDENAHLKEEDLDGVQTILCYMTCNSSLEELARNPSKAQWKMNPEVHKLLRQVTATANKTKAADDQYDGNLKKTVILQSTVVQHASNFPKDLGASIPGIVPRMVSNKKRFNWIIPKNTPTMLVNHSIFEPDTDFTRYMYESLEKIDSESLDNQIRFDKSNAAIMDPNGYAWKVLMKNVQKGNVRGYEDHLLEIESDISRNRNAFPRVPAEIARDVHTAIKERLDAVESSFFDLTTFGCNFEPVDGKAWNSKSGLIGDYAGVYHDGKSAASSHELSKEFSASIVLELKYITY